MILHTDLIPELKKQGFNNIGVIIPGREDPSLKEFEKKLGIKIYYANIKNTIWSNEYISLRKYIYEDIRSNPALWEKHIKSIHEYHGKNPWRKVKPYLYYLINIITRKFSFIQKIFAKYENFILGNKKLYALLKQIDPGILISTYPVNYIEGSGIKLGKDLKIKTVTQLLSWDNITCKGRFPAISDYFISWGAIMTDELMEYYSIDRERIYTTGVPHFDKSKCLPSPAKGKMYLEKLNLNPDKPYLLFGMSSPYFSPKEIDIVERLADQINRDTYGEDMQIVIRPHPQNVQGEMSDESWLKRLEKLPNGRVGVDYPIKGKGNLPWNVDEEDLDKLANLISGCSILLNSGSTISIEGLIHDKPVILTLFDGDSTLKEHNSARRIRQYFHLRKVIESRGVRVVNHYEELKRAIIDYTSNPDLNKEEREKILLKECGRIDGKSSERIAVALSKIYKLSVN